MMVFYSLYIKLVFYSVLMEELCNVRIETKIVITKKICLSVSGQQYCTALALLVLCGAVLYGTYHVAWKHVQYNGLEHVR